MQVLNTYDYVALITHTHTLLVSVSGVLCLKMHRDFSLLQDKGC